MTQLKDLYMAKSLEELEKQYRIPDIKKKSINVILKTISKIYSEAEKYAANGDEEMAYIFYMRYFNMITVLRKHPEYHAQKFYINVMLGTNAKIDLIFRKAECLSKSLKRRYELLYGDRNTVEPEDVIMDNEIDRNSRRKSITLDANNSIKYPGGIKDPSLYAVNCQELAKMMKDPQVGLLIMDCRSKIDFKASNLIYSYCVNVPEEELLPGMSAGKLQQTLNENDRCKWSLRSIKDNVVLMDLKSKGPEPNLHTPLWYLKDILQNWDPDVTYRSPIRMVQGGYESFALMYPMMCNNPKVQQSTDEITNFQILDDIEYPSLNDIVMKDELEFSSKENQSYYANTVTKPNIDRKSKQIALRTYEEKQQRPIEIVTEREKLTEKMQKIAKERLDVEDKYKNVLSERFSSDELLVKEQELLYKILQLENNEKDYKTENDRLRQKLEEYQRRDLEKGELVSEREATNIQEATKRIEEKLEEHKHIEEQRKQKTKERQQLAIDREQKRHLKPPSPTEHEEIPKPKIPQIDRTIKPVINQIEPRGTQVIRRDFSPVHGKTGRGLTGLKNLGNTCYMNSIMQCLSNTSSLVNYFITNEYKNHIIHTNKTQGRVAEEVAALIHVLWSGQYKAVASKNLRYVLGEYQQIFSGIEQQDSHEFLTILMDWLHSDLQTLFINKTLEENLSASEKAWLDFTRCKESLILRCFYGQIKSTVKCAVCTKESATYECFSNLSLELPPTNDSCTLDICMNMYFSGERIQGWNCPNCNEQRNAVKKLDISKLPPILVIHFKRFYADPDSIGTTYRKKSNFVRFPLDKLNMTNYVAPSVKKANLTKNYHLYGVSNHYGSMECGHYTAFCKSSLFGKWFKFDDQTVSQLDPSDVCSSAAYILFYTHLNDTLQLTQV